MNLICLPFAGGSSLSYASWGQPWPGEIDIVSLELPGRGKRSAELLLTDVRDAVSDYVAQILPFALGGDYALFGHSFGALLAYEVVLSLTSMGFPLPRHLFFSGSKPPHALQLGCLHRASDDEFVAYLSRYGVIDARVFTSPTARDYFLTILRADYRALETHDWAFNGAVACPATVITSTDDPATGNFDESGWRSYVDGELRFVSVGAAGHLYLAARKTQLLECIRWAPARPVNGCRDTALELPAGPVPIANE